MTTTGTGTRTVRQRRRRLRKRKVCRLCENNVYHIDFKDIDTIRRYQTEEGKILPRRITGNCYQHQKMLRIAVKRARNLALVM